MMNTISKTIDDIKDRYKYNIDVLDYKKTADRIYDDFCYKLKQSIKEYNFEDNIIKLNKTIQDKATKLDKDTLTSFSNKVKEISDTIEDIKKTIKDEYGETWLFLYRSTKQYKINKNLPEALNFYEIMSQEILDKEANKFIKYEKIFLAINENIIDIYKKLNLF